MREDRGVQWSLVVPVKRLAVAKTRLALPAADRADLALAMAQDVVAAAIACAVVARVIVVSDDERARGELSLLGAHLVHDVPDAGLNPALEHGVRTAVQCAAGDGVAIVSSDVPTVTPSELADVLAAAMQLERCYVSDAAGTGTTLLGARAGVALAPHYGPDSGAAHAAAGHRRLEVAAPGVARDIDTLADLRNALESVDETVAPRTRVVAQRLGLLAG